MRRNAHPSRIVPNPLSAPHGSVAEWFKALVLKTSVGGTPPWVRIPPLPPNPFVFIDFFSFFPNWFTNCAERSDQYWRFMSYIQLIICLGGPSEPSFIAELE